MKMKNFFALVLAVVMVAAMFAGCGAQKEAVPMGVWIAMGAALLAAISCIVAVLIRKKKKVAVTEE